MSKTLAQKLDEVNKAPLPDESLRILQPQDVWGNANLSLPATTDENPRHREDFNSLLDAAVRGKKSDDQT